MFKAATFVFFVLFAEQLEEHMYHPMVEDFFAVATIAQEAIGEPYEGKVAVAEVIRNRTKQKYSSDGTVIGTVLRAWQFSGWNPEKLKDGKLQPLDVKAYLTRAYKQITQANTALIDDCIKAWETAKQGSNTINGAVLYYAPAVVGTPNWARPEHAVQVAEIGGHTFFIPKRA
jgi:N-acetylmuramoyl-L-alanine amidase